MALTDPRRGPPDKEVAPEGATTKAAQDPVGHKDPTQTVQARWFGRHDGAVAVFTTCTAQMDALASLGADAELHSSVIPQTCWVAAVDRIARRQQAALTVIDPREPEVT